MITKMKKYTFLVMASQYDAFLEQVREAGVVHVTLKAEGFADDEELQAAITRKQELEQVIAQGCPTQLLQEKAALLEKIAATQREVVRMEVWGDFQTDQLQALAAAGYTLHYYSCPDAKWQEEWGILVAKQGGKTYFVSLQPVEEETVSIETLNEKSAANLRKDIEAIQALVVAADARIQAWQLAHLDETKAELTAINQRIDWKQVKLSTNTAAQGALCILEGFCPEDKCAALEAQLSSPNGGGREGACYYEAETPTAEDATPIQLKNNFFSQLFEPITRLYSLPNYTEIDPTPFLAPFFTLFFGLCLGDGGYGLLVMLIGILLLVKKPDLKNIAWLCIFLGGSTTIVGLLTGVLFGIELENVAFLAPIREYFITQTNCSVHFGGGTYHPLMVFAVIIGVFQILFAMGLKVAKVTFQRGFKYALYDLAWLVGLVSVIVWAIISSSLSPIGNYCFYGLFGLCAALILFYSDPDRKILVMNIGGGLWGTYNMVSGLLGDVLSYIRLFALGLAGGILGSVFNSLALQVNASMPAWIGWLPMVLIMVFGHGLNIGLALISSIVHPLRLTFVEFYKNAGFEGGGKQYQPFKK